MILGLESSCDETALAIFDPGVGLAGEWVHSQIARHAPHGGVVPDLAAREHLRHFGPLLERALAAPAWPRLTRIAVTRGPGLAACLALGIGAAKALGLALRLPVVGVNHLRAHAWSPFIPIHAAAPEEFFGHLAGLLPHLGLLASGGNTLLFAISNDRTLRVLSSTRDDAAGEALDKGAKLLGLGYPGGPAIEKLAAQGRAEAFSFPRALTGAGELDFSFSGLKTSLRYRVGSMAEEAVRSALPDLCASYQAAVVDALAEKASAALAAGAYRSVGLSGGVANNRSLRAAMQGAAANSGVRLLAAEPAHTGDNGAMIAFSAWIDSDDADGHSGRALRIDPSAYL
ncbi:MAG TPA: tRNA (adenosine(37)-N6)-threonylcarbamoyltransferase complex transferase subunit TsaD [Opitutaceae bacterium]